MNSYYLMNPDLEQFKQKLRESCKTDLQQLQQDIVHSNEECTIFINISNNSQGIIRFFNDKTKEFLNQIVKIYIITTNGVEHFIGPLHLTENKLNKIYNILGHYDSDYSLHDITIIHDFIKINNITKSFIYF